MTRGIKHHRDIFVTTMQSQFFPWKRINKDTGEEEVTMVQGALRPVELWEFVFPKESLPEVLAMLNLQHGHKDYALTDAKIAMIRRMLKCGKIPKMPEAVRRNIISESGMAIHGIGIKDDVMGEMYDPQQEKTYKQEML